MVAPAVVVLCSCCCVAHLYSIRCGSTGVVFSSWYYSQTRKVFWCLKCSKHGWWYYATDLKSVQAYFIFAELLSEQGNYFMVWFMNIASCSKRIENSKTQVAKIQRLTQTLGLIFQRKSG